MASHMQPHLNESQSGVHDTTEMLRGIASSLCGLAGTVVLVLGLYCSWQVFTHIRAVISDGAPLESAVDSIAKLIDAESMIIDNQEPGVKAHFGRSVAVLILWLFYSLWVTLALGFLRVGGMLLTAAFSKGRKK